MANIGLCKRDMAVLPQQQLLAASPFASLAFAQAILERNNTATGLYTPLHLIYAPEEAQAEAPAPQVQVDLHLTLAAEKPGQGKAETVREKTIESMPERTVERILRERRSLERSVIRQAAPTIQNFYHTSVRAALERREVFLQGPVAQAKAMAEVAASRQRAPEPAQLRYAQVLRRNQEAGLTASTRAPLERQAFPPAQTAAPTKASIVQAGGPQVVSAQADRGQTLQGQGSRTPVVPAQAGRDGASQAGLEQGAMPPGTVAGPAVQPEPDMAPLDLRQAALPGQPVEREAIPASRTVQPAQARVQSAFQPAADSAFSQAAAAGTEWAPAIQAQPSSSLASPAAMTHRQEGAASTQPDVLPAQPAIRQAAQEGGSRAGGRQAAQEEGSRAGGRQAGKARTPQAAGQPPMDAPSREKAGPTATAAAKAPAQKQAREQQPPTGRNIEERPGAAHSGSGQTVAVGEEAQPGSADDQPAMAQRALGQAASAPLEAPLQYAPIQAPGQTSEPGPGPRQREETAEQPAAKATTAKKQTERPQTAQEEAQQTAKAETRRAVQAEKKKAGQAQRPQAGRAAAKEEAQAASLAADRSAPLAQAPAQPVAATGGIQPGAPLVYGPAPQELPELGMQLPWHRAAQPLGQQLAQALPRQLPAAGSQGLGRVFRPLGSVKSPGHMTGFRPRQAQGPEPPAAAGAGQFQRQPLTYAAGRAQAPQAPEAAPARREKAAPAQGGYTESPYVQSLPGWARDFLRESFTQPKQGAAAQPKAGGQAGQGQPGASQTAAKGQPPSQMVWTAPGYTGATARMTHKKKPEPQEAPPPLRFSDAEIKRMASQVYTIIQERLKRDQRRLGL